MWKPGKSIKIDLLFHLKTFKIAGSSAIAVSSNLLFCQLIPLEKWLTRVNVCVRVLITSKQKQKQFKNHNYLSLEWSYTHNPILLQGFGDFHFWYGLTNGLKMQFGWKCSLYPPGFVFVPMMTVVVCFTLDLYLCAKHQKRDSRLLISKTAWKSVNSKRYKMWKSFRSGFQPTRDVSRQCPRRKSVIWNKVLMDDNNRKLYDFDMPLTKHKHILSRTSWRNGVIFCSHICPPTPCCDTWPNVSFRTLVWSAPDSYHYIFLCTNLSKPNGTFGQRRISNDKSGSETATLLTRSFVIKILSETKNIFGIFKSALKMHAIWRW